MTFRKAKLIGNKCVYTKSIKEVAGPSKYIAIAIILIYFFAILLNLFCKHQNKTSSE